MSFLAMCSSQRLENNLARNSDTCSRVEAIIRAPAVANTRTHRHGTGQFNQQARSGTPRPEPHSEHDTTAPHQYSQHTKHNAWAKELITTHTHTTINKRMPARHSYDPRFKQWSSMHARSPHTRASPITCWQTHAGMAKNDCWHTKSRASHRFKHSFL